MSYQALARKWRPRNFKEMVGQQHVLQAMVNAFDQNRVHHAYLFSGTRGVGKTTISRIIAKCLNCLEGVSATPCEQCRVCQEVNQGCHIDLIEVDAASKTKVEDTRNLLDNVQYAPTQGRYKIYLIDEVHMLSGHSFNALLKTLEEPPAHVKFLLATTDPQRLPITVLSRCLQFKLKNLNVDQIAHQLTHILQQEQLPFEAAALQALALAAKGSMRDALSLLDQAIAFGGQQLTEQNVRFMLGAVEDKYIADLLMAVANADAQHLFNTITTLAELGSDFVTVLEDVLLLLHRLALAHATGDNNAKLQSLLAKLAPQEIQLYYQIALIGRRDMLLAPTPQSGFEMLMLRMMTFQRQAMAVAPAALSPTPSPMSTWERGTDPQHARRNETDSSSRNFESTQKHETDSGLINSESQTGSSFLSPGMPGERSGEKANETDSLPPAINPRENETNPELSHHWLDLVGKLNLSGMTLALARQCTLIKLEDNVVELILDTGHKALHTKLQEKLLTEALNQHFNKAMLLSIQVASAVNNTPVKLEQQIQAEQRQQAMQILEKDANVQKLMQTFNATIQPDSVVLLSNSTGPEPGTS